MSAEGVESGCLLVPDRRGPLYDVVHIMDRLLGPGGCPWDQAQTHESLKKCLVEETYETLEAIDQGDMAVLKEELGDLLLQPIMHAQIEAAAGGFDSDAVAQGLVDKLVRRHPHVFGESAANSEEEVLKQWDDIKRAERKSAPVVSILSGIPREMPALLRAHEISKRAARAGFEWPDLDGVWDKLAEEIAELRAAKDKKEQADEIGDLLFTVVNLSRWMGVEPEDALRSMLARFTARFQAMEAMPGPGLRDLTPDEWDARWNEAKRQTQESS